MRLLASDLTEQTTQLQNGAQQMPSSSFRRTAAVFASAKHRHIALENAVILPLARERLGHADLRTLARGLGHARLRFSFGKKGADATRTTEHR